MIQLVGRFPSAHSTALHFQLFSLSLPLAGQLPTLRFNTPTFSLTQEVELTRLWFVYFLLPPFAFLRFFILQIPLTSSGFPSYSRTLPVGDLKTGALIVGVIVSDVYGSLYVNSFFLFRSLICPTATLSTVLLFIAKWLCLLTPM